MLDNDPRRTYRALYVLFGGYIGEDYYYEYGSAEGAVQAFIADEFDSGFPEKFVAEADEVLERQGADFENLIRQLCVHYSPAKHGYDTREWFLAIRNALARRFQMSPAADPRGRTPMFYHDPRDDYKAVDMLFGGYLNEDLYDDHGSAEAAVRAFLEDISASLLEQFVREADEVLKREGPGFQALFDQLSVHYDPATHGYDNRTWFLAVRDEAARRVGS